MIPVCCIRIITFNILEETLCTELNNIADWLADNMLTQNTSKSHFLIIKPRHKKEPKTINMSINGEQLKETDYVKYLGVLIDKNLTWKPHIQMLT